MWTIFIHSCMFVTAKNISQPQYIMVFINQNPKDAKQTILNAVSNVTRYVYVCANGLEDTWNDVLKIPVSSHKG